MLVEDFAIESPHVRREERAITTTYQYHTTEVDRAADGKLSIRPVSNTYEFRTETTVPKLGCVACLSQTLLKALCGRGPPMTPSGPADGLRLLGDPALRPTAAVGF